MSATQISTSLPLPETVAAPVARRAERIAAIEWLRAAATVAILWFHVGASGSSLAAAGLVCFMVFSVVFSHGRPGATVRSIVVARWHRLMVPWLFWCAVYSAAKIAEAAVEGRPAAAEFEGWMLLAGPSLHLWYLPFAFVVVCLTGLLGARRSAASGERGFLPCLLLTAVLLVACSFGRDRWDDVTPAVQWMLAIPAIGVGLALAFIRPGAPASAAGAAMVFVAVATGCAVSYAAGHSALIIPYAVGAAACVVAWCLPMSAGRWTSAIAALSFGVYLVHPLIARATSHLGIELEPLPRACLVLALSIAATAAMRASPLARFV